MAAAPGLPVRSGEGGRPMTDEVLVRAEHICKYFKIGGGRMLHAVEDVNLEDRKSVV